MVVIWLAEGLTSRSCVPVGTPALAALWPSLPTARRARTRIPVGHLGTPPTRRVEPARWTRAVEPGPIAGPEARAFTLRTRWPAIRANVEGASIAVRLVWRAGSSRLEGLAAARAVERAPSALVPEARSVSVAARRPIVRALEAPARAWAIESRAVAGIPGGAASLRPTERSSSSGTLEWRPAIGAAERLPIASLIDRPTPRAVPSLIRVGTRASRCASARSRLPRPPATGSRGAIVAASTGAISRSRSPRTAWTRAA